MKLKSRKSEYQYCFSKPNMEYFKTAYEEQLAYRTKRREKEHCHFLMRWDSENSEDSNQEAPDESSPVPTEEMQSEPDQVEKPKEPCNTDAAIPLLSLGVVNEKENTNVEAGPKPAKSPKKAKSRVSKANRREKSVERPPFLSYGWADEQVETGRKKTHNIHAPKKTVYPAALKRLNYLKLEKSKQKLKDEKRASSASAVPFYQKPSDSSAWLSEYQRCYSRQSQRSGISSSQGKRERVRKSGKTPR